MIDKLEHDDEKKARRALLTVAVATIFICNMQFGSSTLNLLGFEFIFDQSRLVAFGQIATGILLLIYLIRSSPVYLSLLKDLAIRRISRQETATTKRLIERRDGVQTPQYADGPQGEIQAMGDRFNYLRARTEQRFSLITAVMSALAILVVDFGVPLTIGAVAAFNPGKVSNYIDQIIEQRPDTTSKVNDEAAKVETAPVQPVPLVPPPTVQP